MSKASGTLSTELDATLRASGMDVIADPQATALHGPLPDHEYVLVCVHPANCLCLDSRPVDLLDDIALHDELAS